MRKVLAAILLSLATIGVTAQQPPDPAKVYEWNKTAIKPERPYNLQPATGSLDLSLPITLSWDGVGADTYDVYMSTGSTASVKIKTVSEHSYIINDLAAGTKFYWRIVGRNAAGISLSSLVSNFTTATIVPPPKPARLTIMPGAQGYGSDIRAAYACGTVPTIYKVTNLNDSGAGSLRNALQAVGARVVVLEVGGYLDLNDMIYVTTPCLSVYGATAPSPGITLRRYGIEIQTHDVLLSQFRIRPGEWGTGRQDNCGIAVWGGDAYNVFLDHMSVSWGPDENIFADTYLSADMNMGVWRSISAEGLDYPASVPLSASHGFLVMPQSYKVSLAQSLLASNRERNPYWQGNTSSAFVNNLIYNAFAVWYFFGNNYNLSATACTNCPWSVSAVGNVTAGGPNTDDDPDSPYGSQFNYYLTEGVQGNGNQIYRKDNLIVNTFPYQFVEETNKLSYNPNVTAPPSRAPLTLFTPLPATQVESTIYAHAGAWPLNRDAVDTRIIADVQAHRGKYIKHQDEVGGYPPVSPTQRTLTLPLNPHTVSPSGYTNLELWAHAYSTQVGE